MNWKCFCVYRYVEYWANTQYLMQQQQTKDSCLPAPAGVNARLYMHAYQLYVWLCKCATIVCKLPELLSPVLMGRSYCRAVVYTNHRVIASHFAYWVSCYPGQLCGRKHEPVLYTKHMAKQQKYCAHTTTTTTHIPTQMHIASINRQHSSCHMPTHACA